MADHRRRHDHAQRYHGRSPLPERYSSVRDLMKTKVPTIFLPLTFITGIYGIYFSYIPESNWRYGFYAILALSTFLAEGMLVYLWR